MTESAARPPVAKVEPRALPPAVVRKARKAGRLTDAQALRLTSPGEPGCGGGSSSRGAWGGGVAGTGNTRRNIGRGRPHSSSDEIQDMAPTSVNSLCQSASWERAHSLNWARFLRSRRLDLWGI